MFVTTPGQFLGLRFLLGIAEAGFYPGVVLYLTYWFPKKLRSQVCALFFIGIPIAGFIGAPVSGYIMKTMAGTVGLTGWQWLFLLEGAPAIIGGIATYLYLSNGPKDAKWVTADERHLIVSTLEAEEAVHLSMGHGDRLQDAVASKGVWLLCPDKLHPAWRYLRHLFLDAADREGFGRAGCLPQWRTDKHPVCRRLCCNDHCGPELR
jgi:MFS family permease